MYFYDDHYRYYRFDLNNKAYLQAASTHFPNVEDQYFSGVGSGIAYLNGVSIDRHLQAAQNVGVKATEAFTAGLGTATKLVLEFLPHRMDAIHTLAPEGYSHWFDLGEKLGKTVGDIDYSPVE